MGGKGGGGGDFYQPPPDTSGYATVAQAEQTLAQQAPLDLSGYQQAIDVNKAAAANTAPQVTTPSTDTGSGGTDTGSTPASAILQPPDYWQQQPSDLKPASLKNDKMTTTQS